MFCFQISFPYFWHPFRNVITTASQYMILAVSLDRYLVICHNIRISLQPYLYTGIVLVFSLLIHVPKFFEFEGYDRPLKVNDTHHSSNDSTTSGYRISDIAEQRNYILFNAYHEVFVTAFCLGTICYCNCQIYLQIKNSSNLHDR